MYIDITHYLYGIGLYYMYDYILQSRMLKWEMMSSIRYKLGYVKILYIAIGRIMMLN